MTQISPATSDDLSDIRALHSASWADAYAPYVPTAALGRLEADMAARWQALPDGVLCARRGGTLAGFLRLKSRQGWPYIDNLHTRPALRGQGIGTALMAAARRVLIGQGAGRAWLTVIAANAPARRFYARMGGTEGAPMVEPVLGHPVTTRPVLWLRLDAMAQEIPPAATLALDAPRGRF